MLRKEVIYADLPPHIKGMVVQTFDEEPCYTIVINVNLNAEQQHEAYRHEIQHLKERDFDQSDKDVDQIEMVRHVAI